MANKKNVDENLTKNVNISSNKPAKKPFPGKNPSKNKDQTTNSGNKKAKIEEIESIYKALYEKSSNAEFIIKNGVYIDCNQTALDILGYKKKSELINWPLTHFSPTFQEDGCKSSEKFQKMLDVSLKSGSNRFEWTYTYKNGINFASEIVLTTIKNEPDNKIIVCVWSDISDRKKNKIDLLKKERQLRETHEMTQLGSFEIDLLTKKVETSPVFDKVIGKIPENINAIFLWWNRLTHPEDREQNKKLIKNSIRNKIKFENEYRIITIEKKELKWIHGWCEFFYKGGVPVRFIGAIKETTERKTAENLMRENEKLLLDIQKITNLGTYEIDLLTKAVKTSKIFDTIVNVKTDKDKLSNWWDIITHPEDADLNEKLWQKCIKNKKKFISEYRIIADAEKIKWVLDIAEIIYKDEVPIKAIGTIQDITKRKESELKVKLNEQQLIETQKIANIGTFNLDLLNMTFDSSAVLDSIVGLQPKHIKTIDTWRKITHPDDKKKNQEIFYKILNYKIEGNSEYKIKTLDTKEIKWVHTVMQPRFKEGKITNLIGSLQDITERKINELAILANEKKLLEIQNIARLGTYELDLKTQTSFTSPIFDEIMGKRPPTFKNLLDWWLQITHPDDFDENVKMWQEGLKGKTKTVSKEYRITRNNKTKWIHGIAEFIYEGKLAVSAIGTVQDITARKEAEIELKENELKLKDAQDITRLGTFIFDPEKNVFESSKIFDDIVGIDPFYEKSRDGWRKLVHPEDMEKVIYMMNNQSLLSISKEFRIIRNIDKKIVWVQGNARVNYDQNNKRTTTHGTIQDITERKNNEKALLRADNILNKLDSLIVVCDSKGSINYIAPSITEMLGYDGDEMLGEGWWNLTYDDPVLANKTRKSILNYVYSKGKLTQELNVRRIRSKSGEFKWIEWHMSAENEDNFISIGIDVTEKYEKERQFKTVIEGAYDAITLVNDRGIVTEWNKAAEDIFGYNKKEIIGQPFTNLMPKEYFELASSEFKNARTKGFKEKYKTKRLLALKKGGILFPVELSVNSWQKDDKYYFCAFVKDITQLLKEEKIKRINYDIVKFSQNSKKLAELLPFIKTTLNDVINTSNFFVALYDDIKKTFSIPFREDIELDEDYLQTGEYKKDKSFSGYIIDHKKPLLSTSPYILSLVKKGRLVERGVKSKCWLGVPLITEEKAIGVLVVQSYSNKNAYSTRDAELLELIATNISNAIKQTQDIEKISLLNQALIQTPAIIMITNSLGLLEYVNPAFTNITRYTSQDVLGKNPMFLNPNINTKRFYKKIWNTVSKGNYWQDEFTNYTKDGRPFRVTASISPVKNSEGEITQYVIVEEDITEKRKLQRQFLNAFLEAQETEKYAFGQELHDSISQILSTEGMYINLLVNKNKEADNDERKFLGKIKELNLRAINETRNIAHGLMSSQLTQGGLLKAIKNICEENTSIKNIEYTFNNRGVLEKEISQENKNNVYRIIQELSTNINRYSKATEASISLSKLNEHNLKIVVKDNGIGLDIKTVKDKINGTGLLNVERRVAFLNGVLKVKSQPQKGTRFSIVIPI